MHLLGNYEKRTAVQCQIPIVLRAKHAFPGSRHCAVLLFSQVPKKCTGLDPRSQSLLHFDIRNINKFARKNKFLALGVCFPQLCSSAGRSFTASEMMVKLLQTNCFVSNTMNSMKCLVNWIPLSIHIRLRNVQSHLIVGLGISQTNSDS